MNNCLPILFVLSLPGLCWAGYEEGMAAYHSKDYGKALQEILPLAEQGDALAQDQIGVMYQYGEGVDQNSRRAFNWFLRAADQGYGRAMAHVGGMYFDGEGVSRDKDEAAAWLCKAGYMGYADYVDSAHLLLRSRMRRGVACTGKGFDQGLELLKTWANRGDSRAQGELGYAYEQGRADGRSDFQQAAYWYKLAADRDVAMAQYRLGLLYRNGRAGEQDPAAAAKLFRQAASHGNMMACYELAGLYFEGSAVPKDVVLAHFFRTISRYPVLGAYDVPIGDDAGIVAVEKVMNPEQLIEAHALEAQWKVGLPLPESSKTGAP